jgi:two-component system, chemotaxis family, protein-glutamate methylesterase/glutaminase
MPAVWRGSGSVVEPRDVLVVGGSAGSLRPLLGLAAALPAGLPASVAVTVHVGEQARSRLPWLLSRFGPLPAAHAKAGEQLQLGRVYVAPPGWHLLLPGGVAELSCGPRVNRHRPAVDVMFASAARWFGDRVVAVVLSGLLDDGAVGAALVARAGGLVVVQEPDDADQPSMPRAALAAAPGAVAAAGRELGAMVSGMFGESGLAAWPRPPLPEATAERMEDSRDVLLSPLRTGLPGWPLPRGAGERLSAASVNDYREVMCAGRRGADGQLPSLYAQAEAARRKSLLLAGQLRASQHKAMENWQLIQAAWERTHQIRALRLAAQTDPSRLRYWAYSRVQARLASLPVIEQAKGIMMAQFGWSEDQAFDTLRRVSQRDNIKVRDLAAKIVARTSSSPPAQRQAGQVLATARSRGGPSSSAGSDGSRDRRRAPA